MDGLIGSMVNIFKIEEIMYVLNTSNKTVVKIMEDLEDIGLIEKRDNVLDAQA